MAEFLYVNNNQAGPNTVSTFREDVHGGSLAPLGPPVPTGSVGVGFGVGARTIAVRTKVLFVSNPNEHTVSIFVIAADGSLALATQPIPTGLTFGDGGLAATANGKFLYVGGQGISGFKIAGATLSPISASGNPLQSGINVVGMVVDTSSRFLVAADPWQQRVYVYEINYPQGFLVQVPGSPFSTPPAVMPTGLDITREVLPGQALLFVGSAHVPPDARFTLFWLDTQTGALSQPLQAVFVGGAQGASYPRARKDGRLLVIGHEQTRNVSVFDVDPAAPPALMLTLVPGSPFPVVSNSPMHTLSAVELDRRNELVVVGNGSVDVSAFRYGGVPRLRAAGGSPYPTGNNALNTLQNGLVFVRR